MNAILKPRSRIRKAKLHAPKGQSIRASESTSSRTREAKVRAPKGHDRHASESTSSRTREAKRRSPKGQTRTAFESTSSPRKAKWRLPKGRSVDASTAAPISRRTKARSRLPKGQGSDAIGGENLSRSPKAIRELRGHRAHASGNTISTQSQATPVVRENASVALPETAPSFDASASQRLPNGPTLNAEASIHSIRELHRQRQDFHRAEKSLTLQVKAVCRRLCAGDKDEAATLYDAIEDRADEPRAIVASALIGPFLQARMILQTNRKDAEKRLEKLAKQLPIAAYVASVSGLGVGSLAAIVGECGDLSNYSTHSKLWKRMGLAPFNGKAPSTWRKGSEGKATADDWKEMGYSPSRRSIMWNVGQCVLKAQSARIDKETGEVKKEAGPYRKLYDDRKVLELTKVESKAHANNRALRYMEKRVLRDLWRAWKNCAPADHSHSD